MTKRKTRSFDKWRRFWKSKRKSKKRYPTVLAIHLQPGNVVVLPEDPKKHVRVQYVECNDAVFVSSKAKSSMVCVTYLYWDPISKKKVSDKKFFVPWNEEISIVDEPKSKWPTVHGWLNNLVKKLETKRDW